MKANAVIRTYIGQSVLLTLVAGAVGGYLYATYSPEASLAGYLTIPLFFFVMGTVAMGVTEWSRQRRPRQMPQIYLLTRGAKMVLAVVMLAIYCFCRTSEARGYLIAFIAFYLLFLVYESWFFSTYERNRKKQKAQSAPAAPVAPTGEQ